MEKKLRIVPARGLFKLSSVIRVDTSKHQSQLQKTSIFKYKKSNKKKRSHFYNLHPAPGALEGLNSSAIRYMLSVTKIILAAYLLIVPHIVVLRPDFRTFSGFPAKPSAYATICFCRSLSCFPNHALFLTEPSAWAVCEKQNRSINPLTLNAPIAIKVVCWNV